MSIHNLPDSIAHAQWTTCPDCGAKHHAMDECPHCHYCEVCGKATKITDLLDEKVCRDCDIDLNRAANALFEELKKIEDDEYKDIDEERQNLRDAMRRYAPYYRATVSR